MLDIEEYTVVARGVEVRCKNIAQVVVAVEALSGDREVPVARASETHSATEAVVQSANDAIAELFRVDPAPKRPVEIIKALRKRGVPRAETKYNHVYAVLRYGPYVKDEGRWMMKSA